MTDRTCPGCAISDDHPRHIAVTESGAQAAWHTDCHAAKGCPACTIARENAPAGQVGEEHRAHLRENGDVIAAAIEALPPEVHNQVFGKAV